MKHVYLCHSLTCYRCGNIAQDLYFPLFCYDSQHPPYLVVGSNSLVSHLTSVSEATTLRSYTRLFVIIISRVDLYQYIVSGYSYRFVAPAICDLSVCLSGVCPVGELWKNSPNRGLRSSPDLDPDLG